MYYKLPQNTKAKFFYSLSPRQSNELVVNIWDDNDVSDESLRLECYDTTKDYSHMHIAFSLNLDNAAIMVRLSKIASKIWQAVKHEYQYTPAELLESNFSWSQLRDALNKMHAVQIVYDDRLCRYVLPCDLLSSYCVRWSDDADAIGEQYSHYSAVAETEKRAQMSILAQAAQNGSGPEWVQKFVSAGMPVKRSRYTEMPQLVNWPTV